MEAPPKRCRKRSPVAGETKATWSHPKRWWQGAAGRLPARRPDAAQDRVRGRNQLAATLGVEGASRDAAALARMHFDAHD